MFLPRLRLLLLSCFDHPLFARLSCIRYVQFDFMLNSLKANELNHLNVLRLYYAGGAGKHREFLDDSL